MTPAGSKERARAKRCYCIMPEPTRGRWKKCKRCGGRVYKVWRPTK